MQLKPFLFLFLLIPLVSFSQEVEKDIYVFHWGDLSQTIHKSDKNHSVAIKTDLEHLKETIEQPFYLIKNKERVEIERFTILVYNYGKPNISTAIGVDNYNPRRPEKSHGHEKIGLLTNRTQLHLIDVEAKDGFKFLAHITLSTNIQSYVPAKLPNIPKGEVFEFQVISFEDEKTILRVDTTNDAIQHIQKIYANPEKYQIIHIPNFKTTRRLISEVDFIKIDSKSQVLIEDKTLADLSFTAVPEFTNYSIEKKPFLLEWGEMKNITFEEIEILKGNDKLISENLFQPDDIQEAIGNPLFLSLGYQDFEIVKMRVSIVPESGISTSFITNHLNYPEIEDALMEIPNRSVILFDEIFIKNKEGETIFLPPAFQFIIE